MNWLDVRDWDAEDWALYLGVFSVGCFVIAYTLEFGIWIARLAGFTIP